MGTVSIDKVIALLTLISIVVGSFGMIYRYFSATPLEKFLMEGTDKVWVAVTEFLGYFFCCYTYAVNSCNSVEQRTHNVEE